MSHKSRRTWAREQAWLADEALLRERLSQLGVSRKVEVHENRTVLVSLTRRGIIRVHRGFAYASDRILRSIVTLMSASCRRAVRKQAERDVVSFPVDQYVTSRKRRHRRPARLREGDSGIMRELKRLHAHLNEMHFGGELAELPFRISDRMRTRLGEVTVDTSTNRAVEIAVSRRHLTRDGWQEVEHTLLHEMIHQWQAESGLTVDHGSSFKSKAAEIGIDPHACRVPLHTRLHKQAS